jgi:hypothetical protein
LNRECDDHLTYLAKSPTFADLVAKKGRLQELWWRDDCKAWNRLNEVLKPHKDLLKRHEALVKTMTWRCRDLARAGDYAALETLAEKLAVLQNIAEREKPSLGQRAVSGLFESPAAVGMLLGLLGLLYVLA